VGADPERKLPATARYLDARRKEIEITAVVSGIASGTADNDGHPESASAGPQFAARLALDNLMPAG
jgi:hypothetical protein